MFAPPDGLGLWDVFVRDRTAATTELVSVDPQGNQAAIDFDFQPYSFAPVSYDGRYVAFQTSTDVTPGDGWYGSADDIFVPGDTNGSGDIFVRDRLTGITERASVNSQGEQSNGYSEKPWISADGRFVALISDADNLVPDDTHGVRDVFVHDRLTGTTERVR